jgi:hypothetical protein
MNSTAVVDLGDGRISVGVSQDFGGKVAKPYNVLSGIRKCLVLSFS